MHSWKAALQSRKLANPLVQRMRDSRSCLGFGCQGSRTADHLRSELMKTKNHSLSLHHSFTASLRVGAILLLAGLNARAQYNYTTLSLPGSLETEAVGIDGTSIVGYYSAQLTGGSFLYNGSSYSVFSMGGSSGETDACGISGNNIVGCYGGVLGSSQGFLYNRRTYTMLNVPGATSTYAHGISGTTSWGITRAETQAALLRAFSTMVLATTL